MTDKSKQPRRFARSENLNKTQRFTSSTLTDGILCDSLQINIPLNTPIYSIDLIKGKSILKQPRVLSKINYPTDKTSIFTPNETFSNDINTPDDYIDTIEGFAKIPDIIPATKTTAATSAKNIPSFNRRTTILHYKPALAKPKSFAKRKSTLV